MSHSASPSLLDLFCGAGGCAMGSEVERAWAAGFFDGEGSISAHRDQRPGRRPGIQVSIEQVDVRPLLRFALAVGWTGRIAERPNRRAPNRQVTHRIFATNDRALAIVATVWPWLSAPKREQITRVLDDVGEERYVSSEAA